MLEGYGEFIKTHRIKSGYTSQRTLGNKCGISHATISRIESEIQKPEVETLKALSPYLTTTSFGELMAVCNYTEEYSKFEVDGKPLTNDELNLVTDFVRLLRKR